MTHYITGTYIVTHYITGAPLHYYILHTLQVHRYMLHYRYIIIGYLILTNFTYILYYLLLTLQVLTC